MRPLGGPLGQRSWARKTGRRERGGGGLPGSSTDTQGQEPDTPEQDRGLSRQDLNADSDLCWGPILDGTALGGQGKGAQKTVCSIS